ncbi:hypothetical protein [Acanthopleuribacter pedis]|uniref:Uncharacterized protein n=1 Tax=Acanthopleuribacter pedis TaxID=442870 RepID=A0A8J7QI33_9BACT|nr:hypothetical protein [Acanthopleuribacter pedis]MBO1321041.1 hypothetical protein [Acanthopleuribacter pedis]
MTEKRRVLGYFFNRRSRFDLYFAVILFVLGLALFLSIYPPPREMVSLVADYQREMTLEMFQTEIQTNLTFSSEESGARTISCRIQNNVYHVDPQTTSLMIRAEEHVLYYGRYADYMDLLVPPGIDGTPLTLALIFHTDGACLIYEFTNLPARPFRMDHQTLNITFMPWSSAGNRIGFYYQTDQTLT